MVVPLIDGLHFPCPAFSPLPRVFRLRVGAGHLDGHSVRLHVDVPRAGDLVMDPSLETVDLSGHVVDDPPGESQCEILQVPRAVDSRGGRTNLRPQAINDAVGIEVDLQVYA
jgi:hypothetical protein